LAASRRIILLRGTTEAGKPLNPPAFSYDNVIGSIWGREEGAYDNWYPIEVQEPIQTQGGYYDNR